MQKRKTNLIKPVLLLNLLLLATLCAPISAFSKPAPKPQRQPHTYSFITLTTERFGKADSVGLAKIMDGLVEDLYEKTGVRMININPGQGDYVNSIHKKKPDITFMGIEHVLRLKEMKMQWDTMLLASLMGSPGMKMCVYTVKDYPDLKSLRGASVNLYGDGSYIAAHMGTRKLLFDNGIDMPIKDFFGDIYSAPFEGSNFQALILGKFDAVIEGDWNFKFYASKLPQAKTIRKIACTAEFPAIGVFMQKGLDPSDMAKLKDYLKQVHKNPKLKELRTLIVALKISFVEPDPAIMKNLDDLNTESLKKGWIVESKQLAARLSKLPPGQMLKKEKKTYNDCKAECKKQKDRDACMDRCMGE